jgi:hypothetical protein
MPDGAVLAAGVQSLQDDQQRVTLVGVQQVLLFAQPIQRLFERFVVALGSECIVGVAMLQAKLAARLDDAVLGKIHGPHLSMPIGKRCRGAHVIIDRTWRRKPKPRCVAA